jgi:hypothetical protein
MLSITESVQILPSSEPPVAHPGLSEARASVLLARDGPNELVQVAPPTRLRMFLRQLQSAPIPRRSACWSSAPMGCAT